LAAGAETSATEHGAETSATEKNSAGFQNLECLDKTTVFPENKHNIAGMFKHYIGGKFKSTNLISTDNKRCYQYLLSQLMPFITRKT
jgi:hypothetical protein